jgi:Na+:H+ antiporter, NhaA family
MGLRRPVRRLVQPLREFLDTEAGSGIVLLTATAAALIWANSPAASSYEAFWHNRLSISLGEFTLTEDLQHWVNDALMAIFFFVVGLEIKRELVVGELQDPRRASVPVLAAAGGAALPALIFLLFNSSQPGARGWGIPMATDIAFAVGVMALLGSRVPAGAKLFLLTLAIVDDIIAVVVIAVYYSTEVNLLWLSLAFLGLFLTAILLRRRARSLILYPGLILLSGFVWLAVFESGVHATIAGVLLAFTVPARAVGSRQLLRDLEHRLHPISSYMVIPMFALANAGVSLGGEAVSTALTSPVAWGIMVGLVLGKVVGVTGATLLAVQRRVGTLPEDMSRRDVVGVASLAGIGFTVSLFIADLAYNPIPEIEAETAKIGILAASLLSVIAGIAIFAGQTPGYGPAGEADPPP